MRFFTFDLFYKLCAYFVVTFFAAIALILMSTEYLSVGSTDLEIEFVVLDESKSQPIDQAEIAIISLGGFYSKADQARDLDPFVLKTNPQGQAWRTCHRTTWAGSQNVFGSLRFACYLPSWDIQFSAHGYHPIRIEDLFSSQYAKGTERTGNGTARVVVQVMLRRKEPR